MAKEKTVIEGLKLTVKGSEISELARKHIKVLKTKIGLKRLKEKIGSAFTASLCATYSSYEPRVDVRGIKALREERLREIDRLGFIATHVEARESYRITMVDFATLGIGV